MIEQASEKRRYIVGILSGKNVLCIGAGYDVSAASAIALHHQGAHLVLHDWPGHSTRAEGIRRVTEIVRRTHDVNAGHDVLIGDLFFHHERVALLRQATEPVKEDHRIREARVIDLAVIYLPLGLGEGEGVFAERVVTAFAWATPLARLLFHHMAAKGVPGRVVFLLGGDSITTPGWDEAERALVETIVQLRRAAPPAIQLASVRGSWISLPLVVRRYATDAEFVEAAKKAGIRLVGTSTDVGNAVARIVTMTPAARHVRCEVIGTACSIMYVTHDLE